MTHARRPVRAWAALLLTAALATACGSNDDDDDDGGNDPAVSVPASASASVEGFIDYLRRLVVSSADLLEPVDTSAVTPPTSETAEPVPVD